MTYTALVRVGLTAPVISQNKDDFFRVMKDKKTITTFRPKYGVLCFHFKKSSGADN